MKRVLLVNPSIAYSTWKADLNVPSPDHTFIRLALAYLGGALREKGHEVSLVDLRTISGWEEFEERVRSAAPDVVGISHQTIEFSIAQEAARRIKKIDRRICVVVGGAHATMFPEECLKSGYVDYAVRGEGEISFPALVEHPSSFPPSFWGETPDLDRVPFPARDIWDDYETRIQREPFGISGFRFKLPMAEMINTRGCPFNCSFCDGPGEKQIYTRISQSGDRIPYIRGRSVANVIAEIKALRARYGIQSVMFHDDQFVIKRSWIEEFVRALHDEGLVKSGFEWVTSCKADIVCKYEGLFEKMAEAGLRLLIIGFESFSPRVLKWFNKTATAEQNFRAAEICRKYGIKIWANYILGVPTGEGWKMHDDLLTVDGVLQVEPVHYSPSFYTPTPGSPLYAWYKNSNLILEARTLEDLGERGPFTPKVKGVDYEFLRAIMVDDSIFA